jgi:hypothetical protein
MSHTQCRAWALMRATGTSHARCRHFICTKLGFPQCQSLNASKAASTNQAPWRCPLLSAESRSIGFVMRLLDAHGVGGIRRPFSHKRYELRSAAERHATPHHTTPHEKEPHQTPESQELGVTNGSLPVARILMLSCGHSPAPEVRQASKAATLDYVPLTVVE